MKKKTGRSMGRIRVKKHAMIGRHIQLLRSLGLVVNGRRGILVDTGVMKLLRKR